MYISLNGTLTVGGKLGWPEFARLAHDTGYGGVDVQLGPAMEVGLEPTKALLKELQLKPAVVGLPVEFRKDDAAFEESLRKLPAASEFAAGLGCPRMTTWIMSSSPLPKQQQRKIFLERFRECARILARSHVRLGFEFLGPLHLRKRFPNEFIWKMEEMVDFARDCGPNVGVLVDSWHWHHAGGTLEGLRKLKKSDVVHVQVADAPNLPPEKIVDSERLMPGEGVIDLVGFFQALQAIGYEDGVSPEIFGRGLKQIPPAEGARLGLETTVAVMKKAGVLPR